MKRLLFLILLASSCGAQTITVRGTPSSGNGCTEASGGPRTMAVTAPGTQAVGDTIVVGTTTQSYGVTGATWAATSGGQATFTINISQIGSNLYQAGDLIDVTGVSPAGYNGRLLPVISVGASTVVVTMVSNPGAFVSSGFMTSSVSITDTGGNTYTFINATTIPNNSFQDPLANQLFYATDIARGPGPSNPNLTVDMHHSNDFIGAFAIAAGGIDTAAPLDGQATLKVVSNFLGPWPGASAPGNFNVEWYVTSGPGDGVTNGMGANQGVTFVSGGTGCFQGAGYGYFVSSSPFPSGLAALFTETGGAFPNQAYVSNIASFKATGAAPASSGSVWNPKAVIPQGVIH